MAESVKRRVAAARLAVAFVAAGTIAGAGAWAQASPPAPTAKSSALNAYLKIKGLTSSNIANGSLLYKDFIKGEVPSEKQFKKFEDSTSHFKKATSADISTIKGEIGDIKNQLGGYIKSSEADARYIKMNDAVVRGDGSVFTASQLVPAVQKIRLLDVPNQFTVDAQGPTITITNASGASLDYSSCAGPAGGVVPAGTLGPGESLSCDGTSQAQALQLIGGGSTPTVATLNFTSFSTQSGNQDTVQILIGL